MIGIEVESCIEYPGFLPRCKPQGLVHLRGVHDLARVEDMVRVPGLFDELQNLVIFFSDHKRDKFST